MVYRDCQPSHEAGFSLIEILIGMTIGVLGVAIVLQLFAASEGQKRTVTGSGDAQVNSVVALDMMRKDLQKSGYNMGFGIMGCQVQPPPAAIGAGAITVAVPLAPVTIYRANSPNPFIPAGDANTDTLLVIYGNSNGPSEGDGIIGQPDADTYAVQTPASFAAGDWVVAMPRTPPAPCTLNLAQVANVVGGGSPNINMVNGTGQPGMANGVLYNFGSTAQGGLHAVAYAVRNGSLTVCDFSASDCTQAGNVADEAVWVPVVHGIVSLRAEYGLDLNTPVAATTPEPKVFYRADTYTQALPACWARLLALRLVLVARNDQFEKPTDSVHVTNAAPTWAGSANTPINLSATAVPPGFEWRDYRYKTLQSVIPLRNVAWIGVQAGC